jgi:hypothetical protein
MFILRREKMKVLELFSGTASFSNVAKERGHEVFTIDNDPQFNPDLCMDILEVTPELILEKFGQPDVIWASPPCQTFSVASIYRYWDKGKPKNEKALKGIEIAKKTVSLIKELNPKFWIVENPRGMLRKQSFMPNDKRITVTYCQYGFEQQKATDLWNNVVFWKPKPMCSPKSPCHIRSPRGSRFGIQGLKVREGYHPDSRYKVSRSAVIRSIIPPKLCLEIIKSIEETSR